MSVLCIGEALIDMICTDKGSSLTDGQNFLKKAGGAPANVAAAIAALGIEVDMAAKVGKDPFGQHLIDLLNDDFEIIIQGGTIERGYIMNRWGEEIFTFSPTETSKIPLAEISYPPSAFNTSNFGSFTPIPSWI